MQIAALTMVHQEAAFLTLWINHYAPVVGRENLYIFTHGHNDQIAQIVQGCRTIFVPRNVVDWRFDKLRFELLNTYANTLLANYDAVIAGDVDELIFVDPALHPSLRDVMQGHREKPVLTPFGFNLCEIEGDAPFDPARPVLAQRRTARADHLYTKPLIANVPPIWAKGYHASAHPPLIIDGLYMAHLKFAFESVARDVSTERRKTRDTNPNLGEGSRERYWTKGELAFRRMKRLMTQLPKLAFDDAIGAQMADLRGNVVKNAAGRGGLSCAFTQEPPPLILPERFASAL